MAITLKAVRKEILLLPFSLEDAFTSQAAYHTILAAYSAEETDAYKLFEDIVVLVSHDMSKGKSYWGEGGEIKKVLLLESENENDVENARKMIVNTLLKWGFNQLQVNALFKLCAITTYHCLWANGEITYTCSDPTANVH